MATFKGLRKWTARAAVALLAAGGSAWAQERPLPEVAREKAGKTAARVFTDEDLQASRPAEPAPPPAGLKAEPASAGAEQPGARVTVSGLLQEGSLQEARALLKSLQHDEEVLLRRYAQIEEKLAGEKDEHLRQLYSNSLARREDTLARKRGQIEQVKKAMRAAESRRPSSPGSEHEAEAKVKQ